MATGYTQKVVNGEVDTLEGFIEGCSRAFLLQYKEGERSKAVHLLKPSPDRTEESEQELADFLAEDETIQRSSKDASDREHASQLTSRIEEIIKENAKLQDMLSKAEEWVPPTDDHLKFKEFMVDQLEISVSSVPSSVIDSETFEEWRQNEVDWLKKQVERARLNAKKSEKQTKETNDWIKALGVQYEE